MAASLGGQTLGTVTTETPFKRSGLQIMGMPTTDAEDVWTFDLGGNTLGWTLTGYLDSTSQVTEMVALLDLIDGSQSAISYVSNKFGTLTVKIIDMRFPTTGQAPMIIPYIIRLIVTAKFTGT